MLRMRGRKHIKALRTNTTKKLLKQKLEGREDNRTERPFNFSFQWMCPFTSRYATRPQISGYS